MGLMLSIYMSLVMNFFSLIHKISHLSEIIVYHVNRSTMS